VAKIIIILILLVILFYMVRRAFRDWGAANPPVATPGKDVMIQDPVCQTYVPAGTAVVERLGGKTYYFCSEDCARHFRRAGPPS
jgi:YHS domain-containing protein